MDDQKALLTKLAELSDDIDWAASADELAQFLEQQGFERVASKNPGPWVELQSGGDTLALMLDDHGGVERIMADLFLSDPQEDLLLDYEEQTDVRADLYKEAVDFVADVIGKPRFNNGTAVRGFPRDYDASFLACWVRQKSVLVIHLGQDDGGLPQYLRLEIVKPKHWNG
jgi:hypothetical protein